MKKVLFILLLLATSNCTFAQSEKKATEDFVAILKDFQSQQKKSTEAMQKIIDSLEKKVKEEKVVENSVGRFVLCNKGLYSIPIGSNQTIEPDVDSLQVSIADNKIKAVTIYIANQDPAYTDNLNISLAKSESGNNPRLNLNFDNKRYTVSFKEALLYIPVNHRRTSAKDQTVLLTPKKPEAFVHAK